MKRFLSLFLAFVTVLTVMPVVTVHGVDIEDGAAPESVMATVESSNEITLYPEAGLLTVKEHFAALRTYSFASVDSFEEAAVELRDQIIAREDVIEIEFAVDLDRIQTAINDLYDAATVHCDISTSGDYIRCGGVSWSAGAYISGYGDNYIFHVTYEMEYFTTAEQEAELNVAVDELLAELDLWDADDYGKITGVYDYLCDNITYDYDNLYDNEYLLKHTAYAALINKTSVCQGYALLFYRLMLELDVDARVIFGIGNGGAHAWNIVKLDDKYYNLDSTWDAGRNEYDWFLLGSDNFDDHISDDKFLSAEFQNQHPIDENDYVYQPPHIHEYIAIVTPPTCTEEGYTTYTCVCGDLYTSDTVEKLSHNYGDWVVTTEPTCTEAGEKTKTCADCGDEITEDVPETGHTPTVDEAKEPTCTETGLTEGAHCFVCDVVLTQQEIIEKLSHNYINGECERCGEDEVTANYADINGDDEITARDAAMTYAIVNGKLEADEAQFVAADVNGDGEVTARDAAMIYAYVNGKLASFPVEN